MYSCMPAASREESIWTLYPIWKQPSVFSVLSSISSAEGGQTGSTLTTVEPSSGLLSGCEMLRRMSMWRMSERHRAQAGAGGASPAVGDVVIIKSQEKNWDKWPMDIVEDLIMGNDGVVRGERLRVGKSHIECAVQHIYPLELSCDKRLPGPARIVLSTFY